MVPGLRFWHTLFVDDLKTDLLKISGNILAANRITDKNRERVALSKNLNNK